MISDDSFLYKPDFYYKFMVVKAHLESQIKIVKSNEINPVFSKTFQVRIPDKIKLNCSTIILTSN